MCCGDRATTAGTGDIADLEAAADRFRTGLRPGAVPEELRDRMRRVRRLIGTLELSFASDAAELAGGGEREWQGHTSPIQWVKHECRVSAHAAADAICVGEQAARLGESTRAVVAGEIGFGHLALMARTVEAVAASSAGSGLAELAELTLLGKARQHSVSKFAHDCAHVRHAADPRRFLFEQVAQVEARFLELKQAEAGGLFLRGFLDAEGGAALRAALEPLARKDGADDERSRERRFADSLVELCGHALDSGALPQHGGRRPHLQVTVSLDTLQGHDGAAAAELELGGPIAAETARRLGCDASVSRVVFGPGSAVLEVGRATRVPAAAMRRALHARDGGCVWPGCGRPTSWSELHHLRHWAQGGPTDMDNIVTICRAHHFKLHEAGWRLIRTDEGYAALGPVPLDLVTPRARAPDDPEAR